MNVFDVPVNTAVQSFGRSITNTCAHLLCRGVCARECKSSWLVEIGWNQLAVPELVNCVSTQTFTQSFSRSDGQSQTKQARARTIFELDDKAIDVDGAVEVHQMRQRALCSSGVLFRSRETVVLVVNPGHAHDRLAHVSMFFFEARELRISEVFRQVGDVVREELHALASICGNRVERLVRAAVCGHPLG